MVQRVLAGVGYENIRTAVIVIIAHGDTVAEIEVFTGDTRLHGHIFKRPISLVAQQAVVE